MDRNIVSVADLAPEPPTRGVAPAGATPQRRQAKPDDYFDRLTKYVPIEVLGAYLLVDGSLRQLLSGSDLNVGLLVLLVAGVVATWFFAREVLRVRRTVQLAMSALAFAIWVFATGGWFAMQSFWAPGWGTIAVVVFAILVQIVRVGPLPTKS